MDILNLSKPKILAALFNNAKPLGLGFMHFQPSHVMDETEAEQLLKTQSYFDYHEGRVMKVRLDGDTLNTELYNRDNGADAAENAIKAAFGL